MPVTPPIGCRTGISGPATLLRSKLPFLTLQQQETGLTHFCLVKRKNDLDVVEIVGGGGEGKDGRERGDRRIDRQKIHQRGRRKTTLCSPFRKI